MAIRKLFRFRLLTVLMLFALVAGVFGYAKWDYEQMRKEHKWLKSVGVGLTTNRVSTTWLEFFATGSLTIEKSLSMHEIVIDQTADDEFRAGNLVLTGDELCNLVRKILRTTDHLDSYFPKMIVRGNTGQFDPTGFRRVLEIQGEEFTARKKR